MFDRDFRLLTERLLELVVCVNLSLTNVLNDWRIDESSKTRLSREQKTRVSLVSLAGGLQWCAALIRILPTDFANLKIPLPLTSLCSQLVLPSLHWKESRIG